MNTFALEIWDDECSKCIYYTVRWEYEEINETDKFFTKYGDSKSTYLEHAQIILRLITHSIGEKYRAIDDFFDRNKNNAQALPPKPKQRIPEIEEIGIHFPLRLYCLRLQGNAVILFNGGIKDERTDQLSKDISLKFQEAQQFVARIERAIRDGLLRIDKRGLITDFKGNTEIEI